MSKKGRVLMAMSGGVDSTVAAVKLHKEGYEVIGITMKTWDYHRSGGNDGKETGCCTVESMNDARQVAVRHGFKHFIVDIREEFGDWVIDRFVEDYNSGRTPNPCVLCNTHIKWAALLRRADNLGCDYIATGHYARLREENGRYIISKGLDPSKDQSYALWGVSQEHLARTIFPLGTYHKTEIRDMATDWGLLNVANKPDSYEICFIPDNDYHRFLVDERGAEYERGIVIDVDGNEIGTHSGFPFYTIGQRKGLELDSNENGPHYVVHINADDNILTVGSKKDLISHNCMIKDVNMVKYDELPSEGLNVVSKIRYNGGSAESFIYPQKDNDMMKAHFPVGIESITPGQALVAYEGDDVVCGGWIKKVELNIGN